MQLETKASNHQLAKTSLLFLSFQPETAMSENDLKRLKEARRNGRSRSDLMVDDKERNRTPSDSASRELEKEEDRRPEVNQRGSKSTCKCFNRSLELGQKQI